MINDSKGGFEMKIYSPLEIASVLKIKESTLRKYCLLLEERGYEFAKNARNQRFYYDKDVITLRKFITFKDSGMTLDKSAESVVLWHKGNESDEVSVSLSQTDTHDAMKRYVSDMYEMKDMIQKQSEIIAMLSDKIDEQQEYINDNLAKRDDKILKLLEENNETQKQLALENEKKGFWKKLFK